MPLIDVALPATAAPVPRDVREFLREADRRIGPLLLRGRVPAFVPCDFETAYHALSGLATTTLPRGPVFCEWGSGVGVVAGLAAFLGFEACGIEAEGLLVDQARRLTEDFGLGVEFAHGSFIPPGGEALVHTGGNYAWLTTEADYAYRELGLDPEDLDVVFAYPWPDEELLVGDLFERYAGPGALLVTYHGGDDIRVRRKIRRRPTKRRAGRE
jgi:hypothetical protein